MENRMKSIAQRLEEHASPTPSKWRELFDFLETNKSWLRHSQNIAMLMLDRMEERRVEHMKGIWNIIYNKRNRY